jgi:sugar phosphate isomerase/epimerase
MRLGMVGGLPADFRAITTEHLEAIQALDLTAACFHGEGERLVEITSEECRRVRRLYADMGMTLPQFGVGYKECLFHPDQAERDSAVRKIQRGVEVGRELGAHVVLIRPGSLNPAGSYAPSPKNHESGCMERLVETLRRVADKADAEGQTMVVETYATTIMDSPETIMQIVQAVGSPRIGIVMDFVNHFQSLAQVYNSTARINHIFDVMGSVCPVGHCKDISVGNDLALHLNENIPGEGELDIATALRRWHALHPDGYMLLEHMPQEKLPHDRDPGDFQRPEQRLLAKYALAARNVHRIAKEAGVPIT